MTISNNYSIFINISCCTKYSITNRFYVNITTRHLLNNRKYSNEIIFDAMLYLFYVNECDRFYFMNYCMNNHENIKKTLRKIK
jgi:hypothetical protein